MAEHQSEMASGVADTYRPLREIVQARLAQDIIRGHFRPGEHLNETHLALAYRVSRGPIREALRALEGQGLVRFIANKGALVTRLSRLEILKIFDIRVELEGLAARQGASRIGDDGIERMRQLVASMDAQVDNIEQWLALNNELHRTLYAASGNERLCRMIAELINTLQPYIVLYLDVPGQVFDTHADHRLLMDAVARRDGARSEEITRDHLSRSAPIIADLVMD